MDKIDLNSIIAKDFEDANVNIDIGQQAMARRCMTQAIHQALVLAGENVRLLEVDGSGSNSQNVYEPEYSVDKQSILDVEKLIV